MKFVISNYNNDLSWIPKYTSDYVIYNQGEPIDNSKSIQVPHAGSDIADKFSFIIQNYENLPDVVTMVKGNFLGRFIRQDEFDLIKNNKTFTPIVTQQHNTYLPICWYEDGMYCEKNDYWYLQGELSGYSKEIIDFFSMANRRYNMFAPGSNYILPKANILKHSKEIYQKLKSLIDWAEYPKEAQLMERNLYYLWK